MIRTVTFKPNETHKDYFARCWEALCLGTAKDQDRTLNVKKLARNIGKKMRGASTQVLDAKGTKQHYSATGDPVMELTSADDVVIEFTQEELDYLVKRIEEVPWTVTISDSAFDAVDFLTASARDDSR